MATNPVLNSNQVDYLLRLAQRHVGVAEALYCILAPLVTATNPDSPVTPGVRKDESLNRIFTAVEEMTITLVRR